jgi:formylmethanofuran dehydrogenase subunit C
VGADVDVTVYPRNPNDDAGGTKAGALRRRATIILTSTEPNVPLEAEALSPDRVAELTIDAIRALPIYLGKKERRVDDFFTVEGDASEEIEIHGDVSEVKWIGKGMTRGRITIVGNAGMHLGAYMSGGAIEVSGDASDWLGAEMTGGLIRIHGNAGGQAGAAYRGSRLGMKDGTIIVEGAAGIEAGMRMKRGTIVIGGVAGDSAGLEMRGGTIVLLGGAGHGTGGSMVRGTIVSVQPIALLPGFLYSVTYNPTFMHLYARHLATLRVTVPHDARDGAYRRYTGDTAVPGKGEVLIWRPERS